MRRIFAVGLIAAFGLGLQTVEANNSHQTSSPQSSGASNTLLLGDFETECLHPQNGQAHADSRNVPTSNNHNQQVVHLRAQGSSEALASLVNVQTAHVVVTTPISFTLVNGTGKFLQIDLGYKPHGSNLTKFSQFVTPGSKLVGNVLVDNGNGNFSIPLGQALPQGSALQNLSFLQFGNNETCTKHSSDINHLTINNKPVGIDTTAPASTCGSSCGDAED